MRLPCSKGPSHPRNYDVGQPFQQVQTAYVRSLPITRPTSSTFLSVCNLYSICFSRPLPYHHGRAPYASLRNLSEITTGMFFRAFYLCYGRMGPRFARHCSRSLTTSIDPQLASLTCYYSQLFACTSLGNARRASRRNAKEWPTPTLSFNTDLDHGCLTAIPGLATWLVQICAFAS